LGELNTTGVAKYSAFGPIERYISETVQDRRQVRLLLSTNRKSHMGFQLVRKSMTLNGVMAVIFRFSANSVALGAHCIKVVEDIAKLSTTEM